MPVDVDQFVPLREAAREYRISRETMHKLLRDGKLTRYRRQYDRRVWLKRIELDSVLARFEPDRELGVE